MNPTRALLYVNKRWSRLESVQLVLGPLEIMDVSQARTPKHTVVKGYWNLCAHTSATQLAELALHLIEQIPLVISTS